MPQDPPQRLEVRLKERFAFRSFLARGLMHPVLQIFGHCSTFEVTDLPTGTLVTLHFASREQKRAAIRLLHDCLEPGESLREGSMSWLKERSYLVDVSEDKNTKGDKT
jgi:hypothetical protein